MSSLVLCFGIGVMVCQLPEPARSTAVVCPPVVAWSAGDQSAAASALKTLPAGHPLRLMARVTVKQRNLVRACRHQE